MHQNGEIDVRFVIFGLSSDENRGAYCALAVASLTGLLTDELTCNSADWIASCQTWEGGHPPIHE